MGVGERGAFVTVDELRELIHSGEKTDVEFKKSENGLNKDIYESVCSFNNRNGGHLILGIADTTKEIVGVNPQKVDKILKDFTTSVNNANKINPSMYLVPEVYEMDGKKIIYIWVPEGMQVRRLNGRILDRTYEEEILRSSGLILTDPDTGREGITLAAILLFGKDSTIMSVLPQYKTDAIYRVKNMDRYDDREVIITNLIDSYRRLMDFGKKHLNDTFVLDGDQSVSARDKILREVISNILAHRDYANAYTAQFVIEKERVFTKNSNLPHGHGELQLNKFEPFPKNPPISKVFREIGYADELGSGMRNTYKYTKLYSGESPVFVEGEVFEILIPMGHVAGLQTGPEKILEENSKENSKENSNEINGKIIDILQDEPELSIEKIAKRLQVTNGTARYSIEMLKRTGVLEHIGPTKKGKWVIHHGK